MVAGEVGGAVRLWDTDTTEQLDVVSGDEPEVRSVAAHDGLVAYYSGVDHSTVRDVDREKRRFTVDYPDTPLQLHFSDDGRYLAAVSANGVVRTHVMDLERLLDLADERVTASSPTRSATSSSTVPAPSARWPGCCRRRRQGRETGERTRARKPPHGRLLTARTERSVGPGAQPLILIAAAPFHPAWPVRVSRPRRGGSPQ